MSVFFNKDIMKEITKYNNNNKSSKEKMILKIGIKDNKIKLIKEYILKKYREQYGKGKDLNEKEMRRYINVKILTNNKKITKEIRDDVFAYGSKEIILLLCGEYINSVNLGKIRELNNIACEYQNKDAEGILKIRMDGLEKYTKLKRIFDMLFN